MVSPLIPLLTRTKTSAPFQRRQRHFSAVSAISAPFQRRQRHFSAIGSAVGCSTSAGKFPIFVVESAPQSGVAPVQHFHHENSYIFLISFASPSFSSRGSGRGPCGFTPDSQYLIFIVLSHSEVNSRFLFFGILFREIGDASEVSGSKGCQQSPLGPS